MASIAKQFVASFQDVPMSPNSTALEKEALV